MVMKVDVFDKVIEHVRKDNPDTHIILLTPKGKTFSQKEAKKLSRRKNVTLICGHYEGFDERVRSLADVEISIGDYILSGGEIAAVAVIDSISRLISGVLGKEESHIHESFEGGLLEYPQYT